MEQLYENMIQKAYNAFNARDIDAVLSLMEKDVHWPNGWKGGYVEGHDEVREYWTRQWKEVAPTVTPLSMQKTNDGKIDVEVRQLVKDLQGKIVFDGIVHHVYTFQHGKIKSMEIVNVNKE